MKLKEGVTLLGIKAEVVMAIMIAESIYRNNGIEMVITSITDSKHSAYNSDHYKGYAFDLRVSNIPNEATKKKIYNEIKASLTKDFIILDEGNHFHIGYRPIYH